MSLLKKASIITTPTAYAEDYLYSIKPAYQVSDTELVTNGNFDTDSDWTKGSSWTISGGAAHSDGGTASTLSSTPLPSLVVGKKYKTTYTIKNRVSGSTGINATTSFYGSNNTDVYHSENGTYEVIAVCANASGDIRFYSNNFNGSIDNVSVREVTEADFDFDRNSTGTRVNEDYLIEDVPYNLLTYSTDFTFWTQADTSTVQIEDSFDNSNNAYRVSITSGTGFQTIRKTGLNVSGQQTFSIYAKKDTLNFTRILFGGVSRNFWVDLANGTQGSTTGSYDSITITNAGNGFFKIVATFTATSPVTHIYLYPSTADGNVIQSSGSVIFQYAQLVKGDQPKDYLKTTDRLDIPRIDYTNGEPSILLEPSRTNSNTYSEDLSQWDAVNGSVSTDLIVNPTGTTNKSYWIPDTTNNFHHIDRDSSVTSGQQYTISIFLKPDGSDFTNFVLLNTPQGNADGNAGPVVNIKNGTKVGFNNADYDVDIVSYGNGWHRYAWTVTTNSTTLELNVNPFPTSTVSSYNGNGSNGIFVYGLQVELGSYATSLIHTSGSAVTRSADAANNAGNSDLISSTEGVLYAEIKSNQSSSNKFISISDGTDDNRITIIMLSTYNIAGQVRTSNSEVFWRESSLYNIEEFNKIAVSYKANQCKLFINGRQIGTTDTSASISNALNTLEFAEGDATSDFLGNAKSVMVFKEALTDLELEKLTGYNNHELYMNYYNRLSYLGLVEEYNVESDINNYIL